MSNWVIIEDDHGLGANGIRILVLVVCKASRDKLERVVAVEYFVLRTVPGSTPGPGPVKYLRMMGPMLLHP